MHSPERLNDKNTSFYFNYSFKCRLSDALLTTDISALRQNQDLNK